MLEFLDANQTRLEVSRKVLGHLKTLGLNKSKEGLYKPWGMSLKVDDFELSAFLEAFFDDQLFAKQLRQISLKDISPRVLIVGPQKRLSWQVHSRRSEWWYVVSGPVVAYTNCTDEIPLAPMILETDQSLIIKQAERHRLQGLANWGVVAEIWISTDSSNPTDKYDIRRILDEYGRED